MLKILIFALLLMPVLALAATPTARQVLAQAKAASGGRAWDHIHTMRIEATRTMLGRSGTSTTLLNFRTGSMVSHAKLGGMTIANGFDGKMGWTAMGSRPAAPNGTPAKQKASASSAYRATYSWWYPKRWPAEFDLVGKKTNDEGSYWVVKITPKGGSPFELWIDAKTHLIARVAANPGIIQFTTYLSDYRKVSGVKIPFHKRTVTVVSGRKVTTKSELNSVEVNVPVSPEDFAMPTKKQSETSAAGG